MATAAGTARHPPPPRRLRSAGTATRALPSSSYGPRAYTYTTARARKFAATVSVRLARWERGTVRLGQGATVLGVAGDSAAAEGGLLPGDVLLAVKAQRPSGTVEVLLTQANHLPARVVLETLRAEANGGDALILDVGRGGSALEGDREETRTTGGAW